MCVSELHMLITNGSKDFPVDVTALQESSRDNVGFVHQEQSADESDISALDAVSERKCKQRIATIWCVIEGAWKSMTCYHQHSCRRFMRSLAPDLLFVFTISFV